MRLALAMLLCAAAGWRRKPAPTLQQAESLWKQHRYDESKDVFEALVAAHPRNAEYRVRMGRLFLERFNATEAAKLFSEALEIDPKQAGALLGLALVAADGYEARAVDFARRGAGSRSALFGGAGIARAPGARRQRPGQGGGRGAQGPRICRQMRCRPGPSSPPSTG